MMNWLKKLTPLILDDWLEKQIKMQRSKILKIK